MSPGLANENSVHPWSQRLAKYGHTAQGQRGATPRTSALFLVTLMRCEGRDLTLRKTFYLLTGKSLSKKKSHHREKENQEVRQKKIRCDNTVHLDQTMPEARASPRLLRYTNH